LSQNWLKTARYSWAKEGAILSDTGDNVERWEAPFFEQPSQAGAQVSLAELETIAQARGFQSGMEEGLESARSEARDIVNRLGSMADQMAQPFGGLDDLVAKELAQLAMSLAQQIVRRELNLDSTVVTDIVTEALATLYKLEGEVVIFVNPKDAELVRDLAPEILDGKSWKVVDDSGLFPGGCQVKTPTSFVDGSVEKQMETIFARLIESCEGKIES
jgi:flagellar assembly protein FliH